MKTMLISFQPKWRDQIVAGTKKYEYRTQFSEEPVCAYLYVSKPVHAIVGYIEFGKRISLTDWQEKYKHDEVISYRIEQYIQKRKYVVPVLSYYDTESISLYELREQFSKFVVPQSYYYLDNYPELHEFVKKRAVIGERLVHNNFDNLSDDYICVL